MAVSINGQQVTFSPPAGAQALVGDITDWQRRAPIPVQQGRDITLTLPRNAWLEYAWLDANGEAFADPDNDQKSMNPWWNYPRAVEVGRYQRHPLWREVERWQQTQQASQTQQNTSKGNIQRINYQSEVFEGARRIIIYTPPNYQGEALPVYYVQDGIAFYRMGKLSELLDGALALKRVRPAALVFVEPIDRNQEYYLNERYLDFLQQEVFPRAEEQLTVQTRGLWGASLGGLISLYLGSQYPELFSRVVSHSGAFIAHPEQRNKSEIDIMTAGEWLLDQLQQTPPHQLEKVSLDTGVLEWLCGPNRRMAAFFAEAGLEHQYREYPSGHNWITWKNALAEALLYMQSL